MTNDPRRRRKQCGLDITPLRDPAETRQFGSKQNHRDLRKGPITPGTSRKGGLV